MNLQFEEAKLLDFNITIYLQYIMQVRYYNSTNFIIYIDIDKIAILTTTKKYFDQISIILYVPMTFLNNVCFAVLIALYHYIASYYLCS